MPDNQISSSQIREIQNITERNSIYFQTILGPENVKGVNPITCEITSNPFLFRGFLEFLPRVGDSFLNPSNVPKFKVDSVEYKLRISKESQSLIYINLSQI